MTTARRTLNALLLSGALSVATSSIRVPHVMADHPPELGEVRWLRDWNAAAAESRRADIPLLVLFQEIPGCATCIGFGDGALSNPLLVEAIETLFVPVAIQNNKPGVDKALLDRFHEPAWNNPVVRFLDADGTDWIPRKDGVWSEGALSRRMLTALDRSGHPAPSWFRLAVEELDPERPQTLYLAMHCFWEGEARLGSIDGVLATRAGFIEGREVVEVMFDAARLPAERLVALARERGVASEIWASGKVAFREAPASDQKRHLSGTRWSKPGRLTPLAAARVNAALADGSNPLSYLSPRQAAEAD